MTIELKIKAKSLAAEAKIIRLEEKKAKAHGRNAALSMSNRKDDWIAKHGADRFNLWNHRVNHVRPEARATNLARAFIKGLQYRQVEQTARTTPRLSRIKDMVKKYSQKDPERVKDWLAAE